MSDEPFRFPHEAMATTFQAMIVGESPSYAEQAAMAAFAEVDIIEKEISRFIETSDVSQINHLAAGQWARIGIHTMECLKAAARVSAETNGAFDVTVGPLVACWRNPDKSPRQPSEDELAKARALVGMKLIELDPAENRVRVKTQGVRLDLGGIGKGYAVDRAIETLKEWSIESALVSGGDSSTFALGNLKGQQGWPVGVGGIRDEEKPPYVIDLCNQSLSGSGTHVKGAHIIDPRTGRPVAGRIAAWALHPNATVADALSTAFMVMTSAEVEQYCKAHPDTGAILVPQNEGPITRQRYGNWKGLHDA